MKNYLFLRAFFKAALLLLLLGKRVPEGLEAAFRGARW